MFSKETYMQRRKMLSEKLDSGIILLLGNEESPMNYVDNGYHFRQDSTFLYYFGVDLPYLAAVIDVDSQDIFLFGDDLTIDHIVWMGSQPTMTEWGTLVGVQNVKPLASLSDMITKTQGQHRKVHYLPPYRAEHILKLQELTGKNTQQIQSEFSIELIKAIVSQREVKSDEEIAEIEKAVDVTVDMHTAAMKIARAGMTEAEVAARVYEIAHAANGDISFPIIATINGQTLHNHYHGNILKSGQLFLLDAGAEVFSHYAGDQTSTFPVDATFTAQQKVVYEMVLKAQDDAVAALACNAPYRNAHIAASFSIAESMKSLGLLKGNTDEIVAAGAHALFFPHGIGHMLGLDVHDMENMGEVWVGYDGEAKSTQFGLKSLRLAKPLKPGFVFTIEPGIYFIPELMDKWQSEKKFMDFVNWNEVQKYRSFGGIRNEDDYLMTEHGARRLGHKVKPRTVAEIESIRKG